MRADVGCRIGSRGREHCFGVCSVVLYAHLGVLLRACEYLA